MGSCCTYKGIRVPGSYFREAVEPLGIDGGFRTIVFTKVEVKDVRMCEGTPRIDEADEFKFVCPICRHYFTEMLVSQCCQNYVCHLCVMRIDKFAPICTCPHCKARPLILVDPDPANEVKQYF